MAELMELVWQNCLDELRHDVDDVEYHQWLLPLVAQVQNEVLVLSAINAFFIRHIQKRYLTKIQQLVQKYSQGAIKKVLLQTMQEAASGDLSGDHSKTSLRIAESNALNALYTFDTFVRGKSNVLAYNACYELGKKSKEGAYRSLFIYGYSGLGKTHLMHSVAHRYQKNGRSFCYFSADSFMQKVARAFMENRVNDLQKSVMQADLLMIDDVHLIPSNKKPQIAGVLLALYSQFLEQSKQVILASDRPPMQMDGFDVRFLSRFSEGLTVAIDLPEIETRVQILEKKAASLDLFLPKECIIFIAQNIPPDVRRLEGALLQVQANAQMLGMSADIMLVRHALKSLMVTRVQLTTTESIKDLVAEYYGISSKELMSKKRLRQIARPRQMAMALARQFTNDSFVDIGQAFGGRDHSTVIHACDKVAQLCQEDEGFEKDYTSLAATLERG